MNKAFLSVLLLIPSLVFGLTPRPPQEEPQIMIDAAGTCHVTLQTVEDRTYFTRVSTDLENWTYLLEIDEGDGTEMCYCFDTASAGSTVYVVFEWSDYQTQDVQNADFNFDGHTNIQNLQANTSPVAPNPDGLIPPLEDPIVPPGRSFVLRKIEINDEGDEKRTHEDYVLDAGFNITGVLDENGLEVAATENWPLDIEMEEVGVVTSFQLHGDPGGVEAQLSLVYRYSVKVDGGYEARALPLSLVIPVGENKSGQHVFNSVGGTNYPDSSIAPVEISAIFGIGPIEDPEQSGITSFEHLGNSLIGMDMAITLDDVWVVRGEDSEGNDRFYGVEIAKSEVPLLRALQAKGRIVIFDGHSNYGLGPNFVLETHKTIGQFTNFGRRPDANLGILEGYTDIPRTWRGTGNENAVHQFLGVNPRPALPPADETALSHVEEEGWAYLVLQEDEIVQNPTNYVPVPLADQRFPNNNGVGAGQPFPIQNLGQGFAQFHYLSLGGSQRLMVDAPSTEVPEDLEYETFFFNACNTGLDYVESFRHGNFVYTTKMCAVSTGTSLFVTNIINGVDLPQNVNLLNQSPASGPPANDIVYDIIPQQ